MRLDLHHRDCNRILKNSFLIYYLTVALIILISIFVSLILYTNCYGDDEYDFTQASRSVSIQIRSKRNYSDLNFDFENKCFFESHICFAFSRCYRVAQQLKQQTPKIRVYIYPGHSEGDRYSDEFIEFVQTILESEYYEPSPKKACLFIPLIDFFDANSRNLKTDLKQLRL